MSNSESKALATVGTQSNGRPMSVFGDYGAFENAQRMCKALTASNLVPAQYRANEGEAAMGNALVALDMANRMGIPPLMVMQNLDVIEGRPSWKSSFVIGALNSCGLFGPIRFKVTDHGEREVSYQKWAGPKGQRRQETHKATVHDKTCIAYAIEKATGEVIEGPEVSVGMAIAEGWYFRPGSKWQTMPDLMLRYRAAAFFGRLYAPHILNGMPAADEVIDAEYEVIRDASPEPEPAETEEARPAGRASGVHAAMSGGKSADKPKSGGKSGGKGKSATKAKEEPEADPKVTDAEFEEIQHDPETGELLDDDGDDVFGAPGDDPEDDDDFSPN